MNKTADRNGKILWRIFEPQIPYVESEPFIYALAHAHRIKEEIYGRLLAYTSCRHSPLARKEHRGHKIPFQVERKMNKERE